MALHEHKKHEDNKTVTETIPALDFIQKLIVHIPEKHFKMLRYYGVYAKHHKQEKKLLVLEVYHKKTALFEQYRKVMKYG